MPIKKFKAGMSLIETMIALSILAVVITAITTMIMQINSFTNSTKLKSEAVSLTQSYLEQARGYYQQNGWSGLSTKGGNCYTDGTLQTYTTTDCNTGDQIANTPFYRYVIITTTDPKVLVQAVVKYQDKGNPIKVESDSYYYNY